MQPSLVSGPVKHYGDDDNRWRAVWWARCPQCESLVMVDFSQVTGHHAVICLCGYSGVREMLTPLEAAASIERLRT